MYSFAQNPEVLHDCYIAHISKNYKETIPIGPDVCMSEYEPDQYLEGSELL